MNLSTIYTETISPRLYHPPGSPPPLQLTLHIFHLSVEFCTEIFAYVYYWRIGILTLIGVYLWYYLFWRPMDRYRDMTELGYDEANSRKPGNNVVRMNRINDLRKARKVGVATADYPNGWFAIMESRVLKKNEAKEANYFGKTFVVWRGKSGKVFVADGYCPHLGAHLGVMGQVRGDCIECPFHGWTFEGVGGKCVKIPYASEDSSIPDSAKLKLHTSIEVNNFVMIWYHDQNLEPTWYPRRYPEIEDGRWTYRGRTEFRVSFHPQEFSENMADTGHFEKVHHPSYFVGLNYNNKKLDWVFSTAWSSKWHASEEENSQHVSYMPTSMTHKVFNRPIHTISLQGRLEGPGINSFHSYMFGKSIFFLMATPISPFESTIVQLLYTEPWVPHLYGLIVLLVEALQIDRDTAIWSRKTRYANPPLCKEDKFVKMHRKWYSQFYSKPKTINADLNQVEEVETKENW